MKVTARHMAWFFLNFWLSVAPAAARTIPVQGMQLQAALDAASPGDTVLLEAGHYPGHFVIRQPLHLIGNGWPVLDGQKQGTVLTVEAPGVEVRGLVIENSGINLSNEDAGLSVNAPGAFIHHNRLRHVLFGLYLRQAHDSRLVSNAIEGYPELDIPRRGDLIRCWYSDRLQIEGNHLQSGRDLIVWFSKNSRLAHNDIRNARYGIHIMYSADCAVEENLLLNNSVGTYIMYSKRILLRRNTIAYNRTATGFGIGLKDLDDCRIEQNLVVDNRVGMFVDNSPRDVRSRMTYSRNVFAYNDVGFNLLSFVTRSRMVDNSFLDNYEQVAVTGSGRLQGNRWEGNYWSDYAGFDENGDGFGDLPYRSDKLFENLLLRNEHLRFFAYSPVIQAINFAARAFPVVKPQPKLEDPRPRMQPLIPEGLPAPAPAKARHPLFPYLLLLLAGSALLFAGIGHRTRYKANQTDKEQTMTTTPSSFRKQAFTIEVDQVSKAFGRHVVLNNISFSVQEGEAVALWGSNGAGKTTMLRCILGLLPHQGRIQIDGFDMRRQGKQARFFVGFVPQEIRFHDNLTVEETLHFYARLKRVAAPTIEQWLSRVDLLAAREKEIKALSGGMRQRLALAIALLADPPILLLDEPTANLDIQSRDEFLALLRELKEEGRTIMYSSHRLDEVIPFADRVLVLDQGKLVADVPPLDVHTYLNHRALLRLIVEPSQTRQALHLLNEAGIEAQSNGRGLKIYLDNIQKVRPLELLIRSGVKVLDFDYLFQN